MFSPNSIRARFATAGLSAALAVAATAAPDDASLRVIQTTEPRFPHALTLEPISTGEARIVINVDATGQLTDWLIASCTHRAFADEAVAALKAWRYEPPLRHGEPTGIRTEIVFSFEAAGKVVTLTASEHLLERFRQIGGTDSEQRICRPQDLDRPLQIIHSVPPRAPGVAAHSAGAPRIVVVDFYIDETGRPRMPVAVNAADINDVAAAVSALEQWQFTTPTRGGKPVAVRAKQEFKFAPRS
jgi:TonB family protein